MEQRAGNFRYSVPSSSELMEDRMRYVIADEEGSLWGHIVSQDGPEIMTRFVYDREAECILVAEQMGTVNNEDGSHSWVPLGGEVLADLEDSLKHANDDALANPDDWGLVESDEVPFWADEHLLPATRR